jgi:hypothetical protein
MKLGIYAIVSFRAPVSPMTRKVSTYMSVEVRSCIIAGRARKELTYHAVERTPFVPSAFKLPRTKLPKVLARSRHNIEVQLHLDASDWLSSDRNVEINNRVIRRPFRFHCWAFVGDWDVVRLMLRCMRRYSL